MGSDEVEWGGWMGGMKPAGVVVSNIIEEYQCQEQVR